MSVALYMDVHVPRAVTLGLRLRQVDVLTAQEDAADRLDDPDLLDRATSLIRVLFSEDEDLLAEADRRQRSGVYYAGLVYCHHNDLSIGRCIYDLELVAKTSEPHDCANVTLFLPL